MKKLIFLITILLSLFTTVVYANDTYTSIDGENFFNDTVTELSTGDFKITPERIIDYILDLLFSELSQSRTIIISIFIIALLSGVLNVINNDKLKASNTAHFACFALMSVAVIKLINISIGYGTDVINQMSTFVTKLAPILSILLVSSGYVASASSFYPVFTSSIYIICIIIEKLIIPIIYAGCVISIANNLNNYIQLNHFGNMLKSFSKWLLTAALTIFSGINAIYGFCAPSLDNVGMKTAKFAVGSIIPLVGNFLSESIETVMTGTQLMKNAVGTAGIISLLVICAVPCIKIAAIMISIKITAAIIEPISDKKYADMLNEAASSITLMFASLLCVCVLFILTIAIIIGTTNNIT